jgi:hypothetical protein
VNIIPLSERFQTFLVNRMNPIMPSSIQDIEIVAIPNVSTRRLRKEKPVKQPQQHDHDKFSASVEEQQQMEIAQKILAGQQQRAAERAVEKEERARRRVREEEEREARRRAGRERERSVIILSAPPNSFTRPSAMLWDDAYSQPWFWMDHDAAPSVERVVKVGTVANDDDDGVGENNSDECCVCMERAASVILEPCRHKCLCSMCANQLQQCPICRAQIESFTK